MSKKYVLIVETATKFGSLALFSPNFVLLDKLTGDDSKKLSVDLIGMISQLLKQNKADLSEISTVIISNGPGSFTGLRVGFATVKGLAAGTGAKFQTVSILDALLEFDSLKLSNKYAFVSIGGGKIAYKTNLSKKPEILSATDFFSLNDADKNKLFITIKDNLDSLKLNEFLPEAKIAENVIDLMGLAAKKGKFDVNDVNYGIN
jgi:tRNA threonylcarbamoyl adenosine modification protein YeaZ